MPFDLCKSAHQAYPDLASDFVRDVHCQKFGVGMLEMDRIGPVASVTGSDAVGAVRTHSKPVVPFGDFLSFHSDLGVYPWNVK